MNSLYIETNKCFECKWCINPQLLNKSVEDKVNDRNKTELIVIIECC